VHHPLGEQRVALPRVADSRQRHFTLALQLSIGVPSYVWVV